MAGKATPRSCASETKGSGSEEKLRGAVTSSPKDRAVGGKDSCSISGTERGRSLFGKRMS